MFPEFWQWNHTYYGLNLPPSFCTLLCLETSQAQQSFCLYAVPNLTCYWVLRKPLQGVVEYIYEIAHSLVSQSFSGGRCHFDGAVCLLEV